MDIIRSEDWSNAHFAVNEALAELLNKLRDHGYNPSLHIHYDHGGHRLSVDENILAKHADIRETYETYVAACDRRDAAVDRIRSLPKVDLKF
ncbi:MAG: hypothetical protein K6T83_22695 [Alicyclobacillus sp.]|nr:hypothetical protein [Alicyclobacillus sp.]